MHISQRSSYSVLEAIRGCPSWFSNSTEAPETFSHLALEQLQGILRALLGFDFRFPSPLMDSSLPLHIMRGYSWVSEICFLSLIFQIQLITFIFLIYDRKSKETFWGLEFRALVQYYGVMIFVTMRIHKIFIALQDFCMLSVAFSEHLCLPASSPFHLTLSR